MKSIQVFIKIPYNIIMREEGGALAQRPDPILRKNILAEEFSNNFEEKVEREV